MCKPTSTLDHFSLVTLGDSLLRRHHCPVSENGRENGEENVK